MEVSTWFGSGIYGVRVGAMNREQYFDRTWSTIEVEMDDEFHRFSLTRGFWKKCPEFRDRGQPVIREWLRRTIKEKYGAYHVTGTNPAQWSHPDWKPEDERGPENLLKEKSLEHELGIHVASNTLTDRDDQE